MIFLLMDWVRYFNLTGSNSLLPLIRTHQSIGLTGEIIGNMIIPTHPVAYVFYPADPDQMR